MSVDTDTALAAAESAAASAATAAAAAEVAVDTVVGGVTPVVAEQLTPIEARVAAAETALPTKASAASVTAVQAELAGRLSEGSLSSTFDRAVGGVVKSTVATDGTDQTAALQAELDALAAGGGGTLVLPEGTITINGTLTLDDDGATPPKQGPVTVQGAGAHWSGRGTAPVGGTTLDIKGTDTYGKLKTRGLGLLAITGVTFRDTAGTTTPFIYTTNTTLHIDGCAFVGSKSGAACDQDAIICGGTVAIEGQGDWTHGFQGYGTVISRNFFNGVRRCVYGRVYFNANVIRDNTVWTGCGYTTGAAFEIDGNPAADAGNPTAVGNLIAGNLIEVVNYKYGIKLGRAQANTIEANGMFDASVGAPTTAGVRCESVALFNRIQAGFIVGTLPYLEEATAGSNTFLPIGQSVRTVFGQGLDVWNAVKVKDATGAGIVTFTVTSAGGLVMDPATTTWSSSENKFGSSTAKVNIGSLGTSDGWLDVQGAGGSATDSSLKLRAKGAGTIQPQSDVVMAAQKKIRLGAYTTAQRNTLGAAAVGAGGVIFDSTLGKPIYSDGTNFRAFADDAIV